MYRSELARVRVELEPWEKQLIEHKGKLEVASTERKLLNEKVTLVNYKFPVNSEGSVTVSVFSVILLDFQLLLLFVLFYFYFFSFFFFPFEAHEHRCLA